MKGCQKAHIITIKETATGFRKKRKASHTEEATPKVTPGKCLLKIHCYPFHCGSPAPQAFLTSDTTVPSCSHTLYELSSSLCIYTHKTHKSIPYKKH